MYTQIKSLILASTILFMVNACQSEAESPLAAKKQELQKLVTEKTALDTKIKDLRAEIQALEPNKEVKIKKVVAMPIINENMSHYVEAIGRLDAENNILVSPQMGGAITKVLVNEGQYVKSGQTIATIDNSIMRSSIQEIQTRIQTAKVLYEKQKNLWDQKIGTEVQYIQAKANLESLEKSLATLKAQNAQNVVTAPMSGYIDEVKLRAGEMASPGLGIVRMVNFNKMKVVAKIPDTYAGTISNGDPVSIEFPDLNKTIKSKLSFVSQTIDPASRTFMVEASVPAGKDYKPNLTAIVKVNDQSVNNTIVIPRNVVQMTERGKTVYVAESKGDKTVARAKIVTTGLISDGKIQITSGLNPGDIIISEGYQELVDGQLINF